MRTTEKRSPCAGCPEVYEVEWPEALAFYCGGDIPFGERVLIETQRLKHPRGTQTMITEGPLPCCPRGLKPEPEEPPAETLTPYEMARETLYAAMRNPEKEKKNDRVHSREDERAAG